MLGFHIITSPIQKGKVRVGGTGSLRCMCLAEQSVTNSPGPIIWCGSMHVYSVFQWGGTMSTHTLCKILEK